MPSFHLPLALGALLLTLVLVGCDSGETEGDDLAALRTALGCDVITTVSVGQSVNGSLASSDCENPGDGSYIDYYAFRVTSQMSVRIDHTSTEIDPYLYLFSGAGAVLEQHDDIIDSVDRNARITRTLTPGLYAIGANSYDVGETGAYTLQVSAN